MKTHDDLNLEQKSIRFRKKWDPASHFGEEKALVTEPAWLVAPTLDEMCQSYHELIQDMSLELHQCFSDEEMGRIDYYINRFCTSFISEVRKLKTSSEVEDFASDCKERRNQLQLLTEFLSENNYEFYPKNLELVVQLPSEKHPDGYTVDLTHLKYLPTNLYGLVMWLDKLNLIADGVAINKHPRFYIYLYRVLFEIILLCDSHEPGEGIRKRDIIQQMMLVPTGIGSLFEKLNPDKDLATNKMKDVIAELRKEPKPLSPEFKQDLDTVISEILHCKKPYASMLGKAIKRYFRIEKCSIHNVYATMKAAPMGVFRFKQKQGSKEVLLEPVHKYPSLINSIIEIDPLEEYHEPWDSIVDYGGSYRQLQDILTDPNLDLYGSYVYFNSGVMTIYVPNPGKFKGRVIHVACNSIQDRLNPVHKSLERVFKHYPCDCTYNHRGGVEFLKMATDPIIRMNQDIKHNVFVSDFSNATDTLSQEYQEIIIEKLLKPELAALWGDISRMEKLAVYPDGTWECYIQVNGQPQGIICSFDFFALAHHVLLLMLMKLTNNENLSPIEFYRILGDDSIVNYPIVDDGRPDAYEVHSLLCREVNLIKNDSKTGKSFYQEGEGDTDPSRVILDFAKISVFEGEFCSSLPAGLGLHYSENPIMTKLSVIIWYAEQGLIFRKWAHSLLSDLFITDHSKFLFAEAVVFGGHQPFLSSYKDQAIIDIIGEDVVGLCNYVYSLERLKRGYLGYFFSDTLKRKIYEGKYDMDNISNFMSDDDLKIELLQCLPDSHKYLQLYDQNMEIANLIRLLYGTEDPDKEEIFNRLINSKLDATDFISLVQFNSYIHLKFMDHSYNLEDFIGYDNTFFFGEDGFNEKTIHTIKGGRERADALLFTNSANSFKKLANTNSKFTSHKEVQFRELLSFITERYFSDEMEAVTSIG